MRDLNLIVVGKLNDKHIEELEKDYFKRLTSPKLTIHEVRAHSENLEKEAKEVLLKCDDLSNGENPFIILMAENGKQFSSVQFSKWLDEKNVSQRLIFIIGGASGHGAGVLARAQFTLSLSEFTFPHKLARLLLVEQIYRAQTIKSNHPYNK
jgi:23S rRNA (pseudouridine1915-N3)-methyltransferase